MDASSSGSIHWIQTPSVAPVQRVLELGWKRSYDRALAVSLSYIIYQMLCRLFSDLRISPTSPPNPPLDSTIDASSSHAVAAHHPFHE